MLRDLLVFILLSCTAAALAAEGDIPLAELDKRYVADGIKQRAADFEERQKRVASLNAMIAKLNASGISEDDLKFIRSDVVELEKEVTFLQKHAYIPPRLDPKLFAIGQVGIPFGDFSEGRAVIQVVKVLNGNEMFVHFEKTDVVVWLLMDTTDWEARQRETFGWPCAVVGTRTLNGQSYLCLSQYITPERRNNPARLKVPIEPGVK